MLTIDSLKLNLQGLLKNILSRCYKNSESEMTVIETLVNHISRDVIQVFADFVRKQSSEKWEEIIHVQIVLHFVK